MDDDNIIIFDPLGELQKVVEEIKRQEDDRDELQP